MSKPLFEKRPGAGRVDGPFMFIVEVGPTTLHNYTKAEAAAHNRALRNELDRYARTLFNVGPYSSVVKTRIEKGAPNA